METITHCHFQLSDMIWSFVSLFGYPTMDIYEYPSGRRSWFLTPLTGPHELSKKWYLISKWHTFFSWAKWCHLLSPFVSFCHFNFMPGAEIKTYGGAYPIPSSNCLCSTHNRLRYIFQNLLSVCANWKTVGSNFFGKLKIDGNFVVKSKVPM